MRSLILFLVFIGIASASISQTEEYIDQKEIQKQVENGSGITMEKLCDGKWVVTLSMMQLIYEDPEDNMIMDMGYDGYSYKFNSDGTFEVSAIIDSDGTWELRDNGKLLYLYNNLRDDEEFHHILMDGETMKWYLFEGESTVYQHFDNSQE